MSQNLPQWPTNASVAKALEESIDIEKLTGSERNYVITLVLQAFSDGHKLGCETILEGWQKSNEERSQELQKRYAIS